MERSLVLNPRDRCKIRANVGNATIRDSIERKDVYMVMIHIYTALSNLSKAMRLIGFWS